MKNSFLYIIILLLTNCKNTTPHLQDYKFSIPENKNQAVVLDNAHLFSNEEKDSLALKIIAFERQTTNEIAILSIDSIPSDENIMYYATEVGSTWGVGKKEKDNGLIIVLAKANRKVAISTGLGTEKTLSDYDCKMIIDSTMVPYFKTGNYYKGVDIALDSIFRKWD